MQQVTINISADGEVKVEASCVVGKSCVDLTRDIENAIGTAVADKKKPEFYQQAQQAQQQAAKQ
jgi:hypothetical protein